MIGDPFLNYFALGLLIFVVIVSVAHMPDEIEHCQTTIVGDDGFAIEQE